MYRTLHSQLNKLITSRLRQCLPPYANTPHIYATGFSYFAQVYLAFEEAWDAAVDSTHCGPTKPDESWIAVEPYAELQAAERLRHDPHARLLCFLRDLRPAGLARSERIHYDLGVLLGARRRVWAGRRALPS